MEQQYNQKNPAVKRLMREACELKDATEEYHARPLEDNLFEWHFTVHGSPGSDFDGGVYHGRILLPPEYPMKPPNIILLTPNGRFETNKKICLSISGHHPETWQPSWSIRTAMLALIAFMSTSGRGSIGALDYTTEERKALAEKSQTWSCEVCGLVKDLLSASASSPATLHEKELLQRITLKPEDTSDKTESNVPTENIEPSNNSQSNDDSSFDQEVEEPIQINPSIVSESQSGLLTDMAFAMLVCGIAFLIFRRFILALL